MSSNETKIKKQDLDDYGVVKLITSFILRAQIDNASRSRDRKDIKWADSARKMLFETDVIENLMRGIGRGCREVEAIRNHAIEMKEGLSSKRSHVQYKLNRNYPESR